MGDPFGLEMAKIRQEELLREAEGRRIARALPGFRGGDVDPRGSVGTENIRVRWGLAGDEPAVAELLELNGMPRWISFEERFVVVEEDGRVLGAVRYRTESKRLILGLLVVDPWAGAGRKPTAAGHAPELGRRAAESSRTRGRPGHLHPGGGACGGQEVRARGDHRLRHRPRLRDAGRAGRARGRGGRLDERHRFLWGG